MNPGNSAHRGRQRQSRAQPLARGRVKTRRKTDAFIADRNRNCLLIRLKPNPHPDRATVLFHHLVGQQLHQFGDRETESLGRLHIDHKLPAATCSGSRESRSKAKEHSGR
jgi:hypothetical protein